MRNSSVTLESHGEERVLERVRLIPKSWSLDPISESSPLWCCPRPRMESLSPCPLFDRELFHGQVNYSVVSVSGDHITVGWGSVFIQSRTEGCYHGDPWVPVQYLFQYVPLFILLPPMTYIFHASLHPMRCIYIRIQQIADQQMESIINWLADHNSADFCVRAAFRSRFANYTRCSASSFEMPEIGMCGVVSGY